jgi:DNA replication protein DnaC
MSNQMAQLQEATIKAQCKTLRMPMVASQFGTLAEQAIREKQSHMGYLEALLLAEIEERERNTVELRIREAHLPRVKTLPGVRLHPIAECDGGEDARPGRGRLYRSSRTGLVYR